MQDPNKDPHSSDGTLQHYISRIEAKADSATKIAKESMAKANAAKMEAASAKANAAKNEQELKDLKAKINEGFRATGSSDHAPTKAKNCPAVGIEATGSSAAPAKNFSLGAPNIVSAGNSDTEASGEPSTSSYGKCRPPFDTLGSTKRENRNMYAFLENKSKQV